MSEAVKAELPPREYEVIYILRPNIDKETSERVAKRIADVITREGGTLTLVENWGRRPMAYEILHNKRGIYVYNTFLGNGTLVAELERNFRLLDEVMRFQTIKISDEVEAAEVDAELIKFEAVEPAGEDEEDQTLEQELGLVQPPRAPRPDARPREEGAAEADASDAKKSDAKKSDATKADATKADATKADAAKADAAEAPAAEAPAAEAASTEKTDKSEGDDK